MIKFLEPSVKQDNLGEDAGQASSLAQLAEKLEMTTCTDNHLFCSGFCHSSIRTEA